MGSLVRAMSPSNRHMPEVTSGEADMVTTAENMEPESTTLPKPTSMIYSSSSTSISSSGPDFRPIHPDMIRRKLTKIFLEASSLPAKIDHHKLRPAVRELEMLRSQKIPVKRKMSTSKFLSEKDCGLDFMFSLEI